MLGRGLTFQGKYVQLNTCKGYKEYLGLNTSQGLWEFGESLHFLFFSSTKQGKQLKKKIKQNPR